jgi:glycosyltransferase involved in cell wall biosynthesis
MIDPTRPDYRNPPTSPARPRFDYRPGEPGVPPAVTIVTPFRDTGEVFHETARSVLQQSLQQWEWLIVDDGSSDGASREMIAAYERDDPRIRVIRHEVNRGLSAARNTGFREARTPYVAQLDSDDLLEPTALEKWWWYLETHPRDAFVKGFTVGFGAMEYLWRLGFEEGRAFLQANVVTATAMIRRDVHDRVGGYDENNRGGLEDWDFWLRCANEGLWGATIPEFLEWYRRRPQHHRRWANWDDGNRTAAFREGLRRRYPHLWNGRAPGVMPPARQFEPDPLPEDLPAPNRLRKSKPRVLLVVPWLAMGGADKFNVDVLEQLTSRGWEVSVATTLRGGNPWLPVFTRTSPDVFVLPHFLEHRDYPRFLRYLIASRNIDVVMITNSAFGYRVLPYLRAHLPHVTFVDYCHMEEEHWKGGGYPRLAIDYQEVLDLNLVSSRHLVGWMQHRGADASRIRVCHTNVDTSIWRPDPELRRRTRGTLGVADDIPAILFLGRLCAQKQPHVFASTMRRLAERNNRFVAWVAGDGPDEAWLREFVNDHRLDRTVRLMGAIPNEQVRSLLVAADVFFLPSEWEGISLAIYEAMACGVPVVSADIGGQRELVTPDCGFLLPRDVADAEAERYAAVLEELLVDPARRQEMGRRARARVEECFRLAQMTERLEQLFGEATRLHHASPRQVPAMHVARMCGAQAVEHAQVSDAFEAFREAEATRRRQTGTWRSRTYFAIQGLLLPYYRIAVQRDVRWVVPLKQSLKRALLGRTPAGR